MLFTQTFHQQFRDSDAEGMIGVKAYMRYFQDLHTWYMHNIGKGNDTLPEDYGAAWVYTRCHIRAHRRIGYGAPLEGSMWMEPYRQPVLVNMDLFLRQDGEVVAEGKLESCLFSLTRQRPIRLGDVDFPEGMPEARADTAEGFIIPERSAEGMETRYAHTVRYSDLDKSRHMNNLRYIEMFQDAYDSAFWQEFCPMEMQLNFLTQCREGETLSIRARLADGALRMAALHEDGKLAALGYFAR